MLKLENVLDRIKELIDDKNEQGLTDELLSYHGADLAEIIQELRAEDRVYVFNFLDEDKAVELLEYLTPQVQVEILGDIDKDYASKLIRSMPHDNIADVLGEMEAKETESYLDSLPAEFTTEIRELMTYKEDTAGGLMNPKVLTVNKDYTVSEALNYIRNAVQNDSVEFYYLYVTDIQEHLLGVVSLRALLTQDINSKIEDIMIKDIVKLSVDDPQDVVADVFMRYQYNALPVIDFYNHLKGIITWDDAQDVVEEETTEEIYQASGITTVSVDEDEILTGSIYNAVRARMPWLLITLLGEFIAVNVAKHYDNALNALPIIAIFMPLLAGLGGNIGTQSITLMVRGLSTGQVTLSGAIYHILREMRIGLFIGVVFGGLVTLITWGWQHNIELGFIVGLAMAINMTMATVIGTVTPLALKYFKIDPAIASGPVIATTIDVVGLAVYFSLVTAFLINVI